MSTEVALSSVPSNFKSREAVLGIDLSVFLSCAGDQNPFARVR